MNKPGVEVRVTDFIRRHGLLPPGQIVVVGVSGGADSVCLLHILARWQQGRDIKLHVAHLNHQLRGGESEAEAEYVSELARSLGLPATIASQDAAAHRVKRNCSLEEAARELRYASLARVATKLGATRVATGHTQDDQVETILMHILRGTGTAGLCGLAPCTPLPYDRQRTSSMASPSIASPDESGGSNLLLVRPLLDITREETTRYCRERGLDPRMDSSNRSLSFLRNRLRLQLLPLLRQYNPSVDRALLRLADIAREDNAFIEGESLALWKELVRQEDNAVYLVKKQLAALPVALQSQLLRTALARLAGDARDIEAVHIEAARSLLNKPAGKEVSLPRGLICRGGYDELVIARLPSVTGGARFVPATEGHCQSRPVLTKQSQHPPCPFPPLPGEFPITVPGETVFPGWRVTAGIVRERAAGPPRADSAEAISADFDLQKIGTELFVRQRRPGDRFRPLGMSMSKKLQDFMVDARIPRAWRAHIPIVCSPHQIVWVVGWRIDDRAKITETSKEILRLEFIRAE